MLLARDTGAGARDAAERARLLLSVHDCCYCCLAVLRARGMLVLRTGARDAAERARLLLRGCVARTVVSAAVDAR